MGTIYYINNNELYHFGIQGQKWGVRRYQNPDGTLTPEGKRRKASPESKRTRKFERDIVKNWDKLSEEDKRLYLDEYGEKAKIAKSINDYQRSKSEINKNSKSIVSKTIKVILAGTAGAGIISAGKNFVANVGGIAYDAISDYIPQGVKNFGKLFTK